MKNIIQIITVYASADVVEAGTEFVRNLGGEVVAVHAPWPIYDNKDFLAPTDPVDNIVEECERLGIHLVLCDKFMFNGDQYNIGLDYIKENNMKCDYIWWADSDEVMDPVHTNVLIETVDLAEKEGHEALYFNNLQEVITNWEWFKQPNIYSMCRKGIMFNKITTKRRMSGLDKEWFFENKFIPNFKTTGIPMYHLHNVKRYASPRIKNNVWCGGGHEIKLTKNLLNVMEDTVFVSKLKSMYGNNFMGMNQGKETPQTYIGKAAKEIK